jgi:hypothetical protein
MRFVGTYSNQNIRLDWPCSFNDKTITRKEDLSYLIPPMAQVGDTSGVTVFQTAMETLEGRPSIIKKHCLAAIQKGHTECLWLCMKRCGRTLAKDIPPASKYGCLITLVDIRKQCGWWKKYSLYSAKGIEEVMVR